MPSPVPTDAAPRPSGPVECTVPAAGLMHECGWIRHEEEVRRSRFLAYLARTPHEESARAVVAALRRRHHDARHVCSAWILGADRARRRSSDDGEPAGTAGVPMLEALALRETAPGRADLTDVTAVVVRYFGGVKLGAGGLVRAYSDAVSRALDAAPLVARRRRALFAVAAPHGEAGRWAHELELAGAPVTGIRWDGPEAVIELGVADSPQAVGGLHTALARITAGHARAEPAGHAWTDDPAARS
ncbi:IMPACT family protein [Micrococcus flavus]|uniref:Putative YigZ family protein n=2 Tax=Micrococcus flavus TaxID=384602 RepID=A0A7W7L320_9MICC|nr:putative YigZ family protein [Micrococcus flavus]GGK39743.1 YigZ family protein [Micrococcus flavus]